VRKKWEKYADARNYGRLTLAGKGYQWEGVKPVEKERGEIKRKSKKKRKKKKKKKKPSGLQDNREGAFEN